MTHMTVKRVYTDHGSTVEPPLDPAWSTLKKLQWSAAVASHDSGLDIKANRGIKLRRRNRLGQWVALPNSYSVTVIAPNRTSTLAGSYEYLTAYLHGIVTGAKAAS